MVKEMSRTLMARAFLSGRLLIVLLDCTPRIKMVSPLAAFSVLFANDHTTAL